MWLLCCLLYMRLYSYFGNTAGAVFILAVMLTAWTYYVAGSLLGGLLIILLVFFLQAGRQSGSSLAFVMQLLPGPIIAVFTGLATGWVSRLFHESKRLTAELDFERQALIEQNALRQQAEQTLEALNSELELRVLQRTEDLRAANEKLIRESEERKQAEEKLITSEERLHQLADAIDDMIWLIDLPGKLTLYVSPACEKIFGFARQNFEDDPWFWMERIYPADRERVEAALEKHIRERALFNEEYRIIHADGSMKWLLTRAFPLLDEHGGITRVAGNTKDISTRKHAEDLVQASLHEKEMLLKEIHHRVKNNLQVISSLLNLASKNISDPGAVQVFKDSQNRVHSMALIHEKLYRSQNLALIDYKEYIHNLASYLFRAYQKEGHAVALKLEVEKINLDIDTAIPCGLILNELVSNALKYAFQSGAPGEVCVRFSRANPQEYCLEVADSGPGLPDSLAAMSSGSLGLMLVQSLVEQVDGRITLENEPGAHFSIYIPVHENALAG